MNTFESQCNEKQSDKKREEEEERHTHTCIIVQSIDTQGVDKNVRYFGIESCGPVYHEYLSISHRDEFEYV